MRKIDWLMAVALEHLGVSFVTVAIPDVFAATPQGYLRVSVMGGNQKKADWISLPGDGTYCAQVMREVKNLSVTSTRLDRLSRSCRLLRPNGVFAYFGTPIPALTGGAIGTFAALSPTERIWSRDNRSVAARYALQIGLELAPPNMRAALLSVT